MNRFYLFTKRGHKKKKVFTKPVQPERDFMELKWPSDVLYLQYTNKRQQMTFGMILISN